MSMPLNAVHLACERHFHVDSGLSRSPVFTPSRGIHNMTDPQD
ncbi:hypothetical protein [Shewanella sp.]|nr:hypothetical protein [Shewanella sp.]